MSRLRDDRGFTLLELLVTMTLGGILASMTVWGVRSWQFSAEESGAAAELTSHLRAVQERAISNGTSYCVRFNADDTYTVYRFSCTVSPERVGLDRTVNGAPRVHLTSPSFLQTDSTNQPWITFTPRGSATPGQVTITRNNSPKTYTVTVEGLTGRVSFQ